MNKNELYEILKSENLTCVLYKDGKLHKSVKRGIAPLFEFEKENLFDDCVMADKIIGKAAALIISLYKPAFVYTLVISKPAKEVFDRYGINYEYEEVCENVINRTGTDICPMEKAVLNTWDNVLAHEILVKKVEELRKGGLKMKHRRLGKGDVSVLGFGCMRLPVLDGDNSKINEEEAIKQIRYGIDNGIDYIDTAYNYHGENSELVVAKALADGYREKVSLATKLPSWLVHSREDMDMLLDKQLKKLNTDHIDYYMIHAINRARWENYKKHNVFDFFEKALADGRVKNIGFSFHDNLDLFKEIIDSYNWDFCQIQLNYMDENFQAGVEGLKYAGEKGIGVIIMEPLRGGGLTNNIPKEALDIFDKAETKRSPAGWALQYLWNYPEVKLVLSGMGNMDHIKDNIEEACKSGENILTDNDKKVISDVKDVFLKKTLVNCTGCKYCMPCPAGVNIPYIFELYNIYGMFNDLETSKFDYGAYLTDKEKADNCIKCGKCEMACPQNIKIRDMLAEVTKTLGK